MKTKIIFFRFTVLCGLMLSFSYFTGAQTSFNPKIGLHISAIDGNFKDTSSLNARVGWQVGLDIRKGSELFFLNPGIHYKVTSVDLKKEVKTNGSIQDLTGNTTIQSIDLPINGGFYLTGKDQALMRIYIHGGVVPSYILGIKSVEKFDLKPTEFNRFQLGVNAGIGIDLLFLHIGANYEYYLQDYFKNQ
ncbi:MAG: PorT family protein, partial [Saprospiraceae bacterium]|nr:PorT family protein [Saprospiraceae bacterium]